VTNVSSAHTVTIASGVPTVTVVMAAPKAVGGGRAPGVLGSEVGASLAFTGVCFE
jgi:hypothetical protein